MTRTSIEPLVAHPNIEGVYTVPLKRFEDERGAFSEIFRAEWFPMVNWSKIQSNRSDSKAGVLRGLHYHKQQIDYWFVMQGRLRVGLADLRPTSPTFREGHTIDLDADDLTGIFIPVGVAHGFYALTDVTLMYFVNNYYDGGKDEYGIVWNDPELQVPWDATTPILSGRDQANLRLSEISDDDLPA